MAEYKPITLRIIDKHGKECFAQSIPFESEIDVRGVMERAFVLSQTAEHPDPFTYDLQYYGYSGVSQFPGYLGYEVESICGQPNDGEYFWALKINDVLSQEGADSIQPGPGSTVLWIYTPIAKMGELSERAQAIHERRARRKAK